MTVKDFFKGLWEGVKVQGEGLMVHGSGQFWFTVHGEWFTIMILKWNNSGSELMVKGSRL